MKSLLILVSILLIPAVARNGCRQCTGSKVLKFAQYVEKDEVVQYIIDSIKLCATGRDYRVMAPVADETESPCSHDGFTTVCKNWKARVFAYRYCGNGGGVVMTKGQTCQGDLCVTSDVLNMKCTKSVDCIGNCVCSECGC